MLYDGLFEGDAESIFQRVDALLATLDGTMHLIANHLVDVQGDVAFAETYVNAYHWATPRDDSARNFMTVTRYVDKFERRAGEWKIIRRTSLRSFLRPEPGLVTHPPLQGMPRGSRDHSDPSYARG